MPTSLLEAVALLFSASMRDGSGSHQPPHALLDQKTVEELLARDGVREEIAELRQRMGSALPDADPVGVPFDELFLLRFVLSFESAEAAEPKLRGCVEWRMANQVVQQAARENFAGNYGAVDALMPQLVGIKQRMSGKLHRKVTALGGPVYNIRACLNDEKALVAYLKENSFTMLRDFMLLQRETAFHICDMETRRTGRLVKMMTWYDINGMSIALDRRLMSEMGAISKLSESLYPQLLQAIVVLNAPALVRGMLHIAKPFFSKRVLEKVHFCGNTKGQNSAPNAIYGCPVVMRLTTIDTVPTYLGGTCNCPGGCVNRPNSQRQPLPPKDEDGWQTMAVGGRALLSVPFDLAARTSLFLLVHVQATGQSEIGMTLWHQPIRETHAGGSPQLELAALACPPVLSTHPKEIRIGPFEGRSAIELRLDNTKAFTSRTVRLRSDMLSAARTDASRTPQQSAGSTDAGAMLAASSNSSIKLLPLKPRNLGAEWQDPAPDNDSDGDGCDEDEDRFFDALEVVSTGAGTATTARSDAAARSIDLFAPTGYESESNPHRENRRHRVARRRRKDGDLRAFACCCSAR